jgi:hypothetical protein
MAVIAGLALLCAFSLFWILRPSVMDRREIYRGVFLTVEKVRQQEHGSGRVMIIEVHWDTPGVSFANRRFDFPIDPANQDNPHYRLAYADWALLRKGASVLINTTIFHPDSLASFLPGYPVRSNETLVVEGEVSHIHAHSYLLYWDKQGEVHLQRSKPPDPGSLSEAVTGIGLQGIPVSEGQQRHRAIDHHEELFSRTFIGVNPGRKVLYLLAFEKASAFYMLDKAVEAGVIYGGQVDSGNSTNLLIGWNAAGILPHTGIRHWRPLGPTLTVFADPL